MTNTSPSHTPDSHYYIGALATAALVGRGLEQADLREAVSASDDLFRIVALVADGGLGKTRLLHEVAWQLGAKRETIEDRSFADLQSLLRRTPDPSWSSPSTICLSLIDLAEPTVHGQERFLREVRSRIEHIIAPDQEIYFADFDRAVAQYEALRARQASFVELAKQSSQVLVAFEEDYKELTRDYRVVWILDTLEQLFGIPVEAQELLEKVNVSAIDIGQTTYQWLLNFIAKCPSNTTLLLAGRPTPSRWLRDIKAICNEATFKERRLKNFSDLEMLDYFDALRQQIIMSSTSAGRRSYEYIVDLLQELHDDLDRAAVIHRLTDGNPIRLALYIMLMYQQDYWPDALNATPEQAQNWSATDLLTYRDQLDGVLLEQIIERGVGEDHNEIMQRLLVTRRGLGRKRLMRLLNKSYEEVTSLIAQLRQFAFVKARGNKIFLHDELYTMYERYVLRLRGEDRTSIMYDIHAIWDNMIAYYREGTQQTIEQAITLQNQYEPGERFAELDEQLSLIQFNRRRYRAEQLHYQLYRNPQHGFYNDYYVLAEQALLGGDIELDSYIQSEVEIFFFGPTKDVSRELNELSVEAWEKLLLHVVEERTSRWIRRLTQFGKPNEAYSFGALLKADYTDVIELAFKLEPMRVHFFQPQASRDFEAEVDAYRCFAQIALGTQIIGAVYELEQVISRLEGELRSVSNASQFTRLLNVIALSYNQNGYAYAQLGNFHEARDRYEKSLQILRNTGHTALQAEVLNNLSRVLGELADLSIAESYCEQGLELRSALGFEYALGLSYNTKSLILTLNSRPTPAIHYAKQAFSIFKRLGNTRGILLATTQLAQAKRQSWKLLPELERIGLLNEVTHHLDEAESIIEQNRVTEQIRLIAVTLERGLLHREFAISKRQQRGERDFTRAERSLDSAYEQARAKAQYLHYALDARIAKAYLYLGCGEIQAAAAIAEDALAIAPDYVFHQDGALSRSKTHNQAIFAQLGKLFVLKAHLLDPVSPHNFEELLKYRVFALTYSQLCSSLEQEEDLYIARNKKPIHKLLSVATWYTFTEKRALVEEIIREYSLDALEDTTVGPLQVRQILDRMSRVGSKLKYVS